MVDKGILSSEVDGCDVGSVKVFKKVFYPPRWMGVIWVV